MWAVLMVGDSVNYALRENANVEKGMEANSSQL